jgi:hypothetical protein
LEGLSKPNFLKSPNNKAKKSRALGGEVCLDPTSLAHQKNKAINCRGFGRFVFPIHNFPFPGITNSFAFTDLLLVADGKVDVPKTTFVKMNSSFEIKVKTTYDFCKF